MMDELKAYEAYICHNEFSQDELPQKKDAIVESASHKEDDDWWDYSAKIECYRKEDADKVIADLEEKVEELTGELRIARPTFKCAECGEVGPHKWVWNGKEGADFVARRCCDKCIKEKGLTLWPRVHSCEEKCTEFNALKYALRWRKCSEESPKDDEYVLAFCPNLDSVEKARLLEDGVWRDSTWNFLEVTHWMPLPKAPEDK